MREILLQLWLGDVAYLSEAAFIILIDVDSNVGCWVQGLGRKRL